MANDIYARMQKLGTRLLTDFSQGTIEYVKMVPGAGPAHNPGPSTPQTTVLKAVARPVKGTILLDPNSLIKAGDLKVTAAIVAGLTPSTSDKIKIDGKTYTIIKIDVLPPAGTPAVWAFYVRR